MLPIPGGIHFRNNEKTRNLSIQSITSPEYIYLPIPQGYSIVALEKQQIYKGQIIASKDDDSLPPIYASVSGMVESISENKTVVIQNDYKNSIYPELSPVDIPLTQLSEKEIESTVRLMGIYDNGTPLSQKLKACSGKIENLIISCTDSEPPAGPNGRILKEYSKEILGGIKILIHATKARVGFIAVSDTDSEFAEFLKESISDKKLISVKIVENKYPIENHKYLLYGLTRKEYQEKDIVKNSRSLILSVESVLALYKCFATGIPVTEKFVSVCGKVKEIKNLSVPIGTKIHHILEFCGGITSENVEIIKGGIMRGSVVDENSIISHDVSSITVTEREQTKQRLCIRCGKCIEICPMLLKPLYIYSNIVSMKNEKNIYLGIIHCIECGCCSYICPSKIPLSQTIVAGKENVIKLQK